MPAEQQPMAGVPRAVEHRVARMLHQILENQSLLLHLSLRDMVRMCNALLADRCREFVAAGAAVDGIIGAVCAWLKHRLCHAPQEPPFPRLPWAQREDSVTLEDAAGLQGYLGSKIK